MRTRTLFGASPATDTARQIGSSPACAWAANMRVGIVPIWNNVNVSFEDLATGEATAIKPMRARQSHDRVIFTNSDKCWIRPHWGVFQ
jgi:hypothetical protein